MPNETQKPNDQANQVHRLVMTPELVGELLDQNEDCKAASGILGACLSIAFGTTIGCETRGTTIVDVFLRDQQTEQIEAIRDFIFAIPTVPEDDRPESSVRFSMCGFSVPVGHFTRSS